MNINEQQNEEIKKLKDEVLRLTTEVHNLKRQVETLITKQASLVGLATIAMQVLLHFVGS